ncbi:Na/Pi symporter [Sediminitomix flava]|uniref:Sodium-dependent phosphate cotransporter n=1 Tax=Sediminitomix flava TaxID=379075 RepID=A0A315ZA96_SEDFL|nr:Na/Pi symporter [Sediminitomix flava]PWJ42089.1 sodium-dependent phosphate cotransporter [Sediminitomix flava]
MSDSNELTNKIQKILVQAFKLVAVMFVFLVALNLMSSGFKLLGKDIATEMITLTSNPFVGLFIGLLATALVQSSSTTTSMIVAIVASGSLSLQNAVPMIMGANIGTSVTSTIVALGHLSDKSAFNKAIGAATVHDFFNLIVVLILFPLEVYFGVLSSVGAFASSIFYNEQTENTKMFSIMGVTVKPVVKYLSVMMSKNAYMIITVSTMTLFISLHQMTSLLKKQLVGKAQESIDSTLFGSPIKSLFWGTVITAGVQSSSVTTSLAVPLVAADKISLKKAFPFLMGANIGTTVTAMIAALSQNEAALAVAFCHLGFNLFGVLILFPFPKVRNIPIWCAETLGRASMKNRAIGLSYTLVVFFLLPFSLIYATTDLDSKKEKQDRKTQIVSPVAKR